MKHAMQYFHDTVEAAYDMWPAPPAAVHWADYFEVGLCELLTLADLWWMWDHLCDDMTDAANNPNDPFYHGYPFAIIESELLRIAKGLPQ